jgi:hypothetical protein
VNVDVTRSENEGRQPLPADPEMRVLFHRLNNQLGIVLAHAELLEAIAAGAAEGARARQIVTGVLEAMGTSREIRRRAEAETEHLGV